MKGSLDVTSPCILARALARVMEPDDSGRVNLGDAPDLLETLSQRLERDRIRAKLFGDAPEAVRVGRFVLERSLSAGSMGVVYVARDEQLRRPVALKVLRSSAQPEDGQTRLLREAQAMARLSHPNVATVFEAGLWEGRVYMAMELVQGRTLREWLREKQPGQKGLLDAFVQAANGLAAAHEEGLVHRDFKPDNVMVGDDGRVRVVDFGLACAETATGGEVLSGGAAVEPSSTFAPLSTFAVAGTPAYMAPEQYRGEALDARADQFAFCVALQEALHGERPYAGETIEEIQASIAAGAARPKGRGKVPVWLDKAVRRGLSPRAEDRWPSMRALVAELGKDRSGPRRRTLVAAGALLAAAVAVALYFVLGRGLQNGARPAHDPEAVAAYQRAMQNRDGGGPFVPELLRAVQLDPSLAEAHLQLVLGETNYVTPAEREHFRLAREGRASFSPLEKALLDSLEPVFTRQPSDWEEGARRVRAALEQFPHDAQLWAQLAEYESHLGQIADALQHHERALAEEPGYYHSVQMRGHLLIQLGRVDEGRAALSACAYGQSASLSCTMILAHLYADEGACDAMEPVARHMIAGGATPGEGEFFLAASLAGQGKPKEAVVQAGEWAASHVSDTPAIPLSQVFRFKVAMWAGDFDGAERAAREIARLAETSNQRLLRGGAATISTLVLLETGREAEAGDVAMDYLSRKDAWEPVPTGDDMAVFEDYTPFLLRVARTSGRLGREDFLARLGAWITDWETRIPAVYRSALWLQAYGLNVDSKESAGDALRALPSYAPLPAVEIKSMHRWGVGIAHLLEGRPAEALPHLEHAAKSCRGLWAPLEHTRVQAWLGRAYQETGDIKRACSAYRVVLDRWGDAKPKSVTVERIRDWMRGMECPR